MSDETNYRGVAYLSYRMTAAHLDRQTRKSTPWPAEIRAAAARLGGAEAPAA